MLTSSQLNSEILNDKSASQVNWIKQRDDIEFDMAGGGGGSGGGAGGGA